MEDERNALSPAILIPAMDALAPIQGPAVDVAGASEDELEALAREWPALSSAESFPSPLSLLAYRGAGTVEHDLCAGFVRFRTPA